MLLSTLVDNSYKDPWHVKFYQGGQQRQGPLACYILLRRTAMTRTPLNVAFYLGGQQRQGPFSCYFLPTYLQQRQGPL